MKTILEYNSYNKSKSIVDSISYELSKIFKHVKSSNSTITASSKVDKGGNPIVRIDSKTPVKGLMLKFGEGFIEIKSIVNSTVDKGLSSEVIKAILDSIDKDYIIKINNDVSGGFWDNIIKKYPEYNWIKS